MHAENADPLETVAGAVGDRTPLDWEEALSRHPELSGALANLRAIDSIAAAYGGSAADLEGEEAAAGEPFLFRWGSMQVRRKLGEGAFGEVYAAWDPALQREVALKLRRPEAAGLGDGVLRWLAEARRLARVRHPNALLVYGADVHEGRAGHWTDLLPGRTLEEWLSQHGPMSAREAAGIGQELCAGLAAVHAAGLVHGDVKASNVMRVGGRNAPDGTGRIVLMDFGSARETVLPTASASPGTPLSTAPEVLRGEPATPVSDLYSLGVLLYRLVSGHFPIETTDLGELVRRLQNEEAVPLRARRPDLPRPFLRVVERALAREAGERYRSAAEMERALSEALAPDPRGGRRSWLWVSITAIVIGLITVPLVARRPGSTSPAPSAGGTGSEAGRSEAPTTVPTGAGISSAARARPGAAPPVVPAPEVEAVLQQVGPSGTHPISTGGRVGPGDQLFLELECRTPSYAYVLDEDQQGELFLLFPYAGSKPSNPLSAGVRHRLPGRIGDSDLNWQVTSAGGQETILILAAAEPIAAIDGVLASVPPVRAGEPVNYAALPPSSLDQVRGIGAVTTRPAEPEAPEGGRLQTLARRLGQSKPGEGGIWIRLITLDNP